GFVVFQAGQGLDDLVVALPVARGAADAAVHHQLLGVLGHLRVEVVHQHAQRRFGQPALGGQLVATRGADFGVAESGSFHGGFLLVGVVSRVTISRSHLRDRRYLSSLIHTTIYKPVYTR